jgi:hypothetical protein
VRQRLCDPSAPPHRLLRPVQTPPPLDHSFAEVLLAGGDDGRKHRFVAGGRRDGGYGGRWQEGGDRREGAGASNWP